MTKDEALRLALEALEDETNEKYCPAITAIKAALEAKDEPSMKVEGPLHVICQCDKCKPQIAHNPKVVGYVAPQREWVGLTAEEIHDTPGYQETREMYRFALAIEAKLKELNK